MEELGIIRRTIQDVLVPEMQAIKDRLAGHDEKFVSIDKRFDQVDKRFDQVERRLDALEKSVAELKSGMDQMRATLERIEARLQFLDFDKRLYRLELLLDQRLSGAGPKPGAAA